MRNLRGLGTQGLLLVAGMGVAGQAHAACNGPQALVAQLRTHPTAEKAANLGNWYATRHQFDCAVEAFRVGLKAEPRSAQLHYLTGLALVAQKQVAQAIPELQKSIQLDPSAVKPHIVLASVYDSANRPDQAEHEWRQALALDAKAEPALEGLTELYMRRQDYPSVIQLLQNAPRTEALTIPLSKALGLMGYLDQAEAVLKEALDQNPKSMPLAQAMSIVLIQEHKYEDAVKLQRTVVKYHPDDLEASIDLFRMLVLANHIDEARPMGPKLLAARPHDPQVLYYNGVVQRAVGDYPAAKKLLEEAVALQPDFFYSRYHLGLVLVLLHEYPEAKVNLEKAIALGDTQPEVHFELAKALRGLGEMDRATQEMKTYQNMMKQEETRLEAVEAAAQGDAALRDGKAAEAVTHYKDAVQAEADNANFHYKLAIALHATSDTTAEKAQLEEAVKLDPKLAGAHNALGILLTTSGDVQGAVAQFRAAAESAPNWVDAWINLAAESAEAGQFPEARQAVSRALSLDPSNQQAKELSDQLARDPRAQATQP